MSRRRTTTMRSAWLGLYLVVVTGASCGFTRLPELADGGGADGGDDGGPPPLGLELIAGDIGGLGDADGIGGAARFRNPGGVAVDSAGTVYVADTTNHTIRKVTPAGVVTTLAGTGGLSGGADGTGAAARFFNPNGVAIDNAGSVYVADNSNHTIRKITAGGVVTTLAGTGGASGSADGTGAAARFFNPASVAIDNAGNVYVADNGNHAIRKVTTGGVVTTLAGAAGVSGSADGTGDAARFLNPTGVAVDSVRNVYVADSGNHTIRKITPAGVVTTLAGTAGISGSADDTGAAARFNRPSGIAVDGAGNVYIGDTDNHALRKVTAAGVATTLAGTANELGSADGTGAAARFSSLRGVAVDSAGNVYVADRLNNAIRKVSATGVVTKLAGTPNVFGSADGPGAAAGFFFPAGVASDGAGNVYVADRDNHTIRKITAAGIVMTLAGTARTVGSADGTGAAARFFFPTHLAVDGAGNVYVADQLNDTIRKVTPTGVVTTLAGMPGMGGSADGTGSAARFESPEGVAVDSAGNIYTADRDNHTIRKITPAGVVTTLAGTATMSGSADGTGAAARFERPSAVAIDGAGNLYVTDRANHTVRKVTPAGVVTTLAGTADLPGSADEIGATARFDQPGAVVVDSAGNLYVADTRNSTIRKVTPTGATTTVGGMAGVAGVVLGATPRFSSPQGLAIVGDTLVISDANAVLRLHLGAR